MTSQFSRTTRVRTAARVQAGFMVFAGAWVAATVPAALGQDMSPATREHVRKATVMVQTRVPGTDQGGSGTGEFINSNGLCMTNNHVVDMNHGKSLEERSKMVRQTTLPKYSVIINSGTPDEAEYDAQLLHQTEPGDMAILQVKDENGRPLETPNYLRFSNPGTLEVGGKVWIFGFPGGLSRGREVAITSGLITDLAKTSSGAVNYVESDATAHPGNSGGPMVNVDGRLVGIVTHLRLKERSKDTSGAVPFTFVQQFIRSGYDEGRIPKSTDVLPFVDFFTDYNGVVNFSTYPRSDDEAFVHDVKKNVRSGTCKDSTLTVDTTLGKFAVPLARAAYLFVRDARGTLILDGGDMLAFPIAQLALEFQFGTKTEKIKLRDLDAVAFPEPSSPVKYPPGMGTWLDADGSRLGLSSIDGTVPFAGATYNMSDLVAIEAEREDLKMLRTARGERVRGKFDQHAVTARTPWSEEPISVALNGVHKATARPVNWTYINADGRLLAERLEIDDENLQSIAETLDSPDWAQAAPAIKRADESKSLSGEARKQLALFQGIERLRAGKYDEAKDIFKRNRSKKSEVGWIAESYLALLEVYPDGTYRGEPLSDPDVVWRASTEAAMKIIADADARMDKLEDLEYSKQEKELKNLEEAFDNANRLRLGVAQGRLVNLLDRALEIHVEGFYELVAEYNETVARHNSERVRSAQQKWERRLRATDSRLENIREEWYRCYERLQEESAGFSVDPPKFDRKKK